jgi:hypothetical protein
MIAPTLSPVPSRFRSALLHALLVALSAAVAPAQTTRTVDFSVAHDYRSGDVTGTIWSGVLNASGPTVANAASANAGVLTITSSGLGWDGAANNGFLLYVTVPARADFTARVAISGTPGTAAFNDGGLMIRRPAPVGAASAENWIEGKYFAYGGGQNTLRSNVNGTTPSFGGPAGQKFLELKRVGNIFTYSAGGSFASLSAVASVTRSDLDGLGTLQVGLWQGTFVGNSASFNFDDFSLTLATATLAAPTSASVTTATATLGADITGDGGDANTARGVVYSLTSANPNPTLNATGVTNVSTAGTTGMLTVPVSGLTPGTSYSFAAYATNGGGTAYSSSGTFTTVPPPPTVSAISPTAGPTAGGRSASITGTNFTGATGVTIGGVAATSVSVTNATTLTCVTPAGPAGPASVLVTTLGGTNSANALFTYLAPLSGVRKIGPTGDYPTMAAAVAAIQAGGLSGPLTLEFQTAYVSTVETFPVTFTNLGTTATNTVTLRPETGATGLVITGANTTAATIDLNNANYLTIDGRPGGLGTVSQLTIANTATAGIALRFINEASNNAVQYVALKGVNTGSTGGVVVFGTTTGANGNDNNTIDRCDIGDGATPPAINIFALGSTSTTARNNSGNIISNSNIFNFYSASVNAAGIWLDAGNTGWTISGNSFYQTATRAAAPSGSSVLPIYVSSPAGDNFTVTGNFIGGDAPGATVVTQKWTTTGTSSLNNFQGIRMKVGTGTPSSRRETPSPI